MRATTIPDRQRFSFASRLLHWAMAFTLLYILLTVLLRLGWMNKDHLGAIAQAKLSEMAQGSLDAKQASDLGKALRKPMWSTHVYAGYVMIALYLGRLILVARNGLNFPSPFGKGLDPKTRFKGIVYVIFYLCLAASLITGFIIVNGPSGWKEACEAVHVQALYYVITFIVLHIGGVILADAREEPGIISKMVSGPREPRA